MPGDTAKTNNKPDLLVITSTFPRWKDDREPRFVFDLCQQLRYQFTIHVLAPHAPGAARYEILDGLYVTRFRYFIPRWQSLAYEGGMLTRLRLNPLRLALVPLFLLAEALAARRLLKIKNFALIHTHWLIPQGLVAVLACLGLARKPPILCTLHGADLYAFRRPPFVQLKRWVLRRCTAVTVVSRAMSDTLRILYPPIEQLDVIPMGTNLCSLFHPEPYVIRKTKTLLFSRLVEKKGVNYLIHAFALLQHAHPGVELLIAGSGPEQDALRQLAVQLGVARSTHFLGAVSHEQLADLYQQASIAIVPSVVAHSGDQEGFGLVIVEALGCECPVIASDLPAIHDIIQDEVTGLLARPADPVHLAERIAFLLERPQLRSILGRQGREYVLQYYDWSQIRQRYTSLIEQMMKTEG